MGADSFFYCLCYQYKDGDTVQKNMSNLAEAKKRLILNVSTNILQIFMFSVVMLWLTPFLISKLGVALYGMVPLVTSITRYFGLLTLAISATVGRFVVVNYAKGNYPACNRYFNTSLFVLGGASVVLVLVGLVISFFFADIFNVPEGHEFQSGILFLSVVISTVVTAITSSFLVSTLIKHRFDLQNISKIAGKLLQVVFIVSCFYLLKPELGYVGISYLAMALCILAFSMFFTKKLTPEFKLSINDYSKTALTDMLGMGIWTTINQLGALLYLSIDMVVINVFLGATQCGRYAPVLQWLILLQMLGGAISGVLTPIFYELIGKGDIDQLIRQLRKSLRFMAALMLLPISLLCGFSKPLLTCWLGNDFAEFHLLMWILIAPAAVNMIIMPAFAIFRGMNRVKLPAIMTIIGGVLNVILSSILVNTSLGIYGVAISTMICLLAKNLIFTPIYSGKILDSSKLILYGPITKSVLMFSVFAVVCYSVSCNYDLTSYFRLISVGAIMAVIYLPFAFLFILNRQDRSFLVSLIRFKS